MPITAYHTSTTSSPVHAVNHLPSTAAILSVEMVSNVPLLLQHSLNATCQHRTGRMPLPQANCVSQQPQLRTGGFCLSKALLPHALADGN